MQIAKILKICEATLLTEGVDLQTDITSGYSCDLLSWVMAHGKPGMAWITIQTHMNVVAVATLHDMACVIVPEGAQVPAEVCAKAAEEGIALLSSNLPAFTLAGRLYAAGLTGE